MKKLFLAGATLAVLGGGALAADLTPVYALPVEPSGWSGLYVGINVGGTWSSANDVTITTFPMTGFPGSTPPAAVTDGSPAAASASGIFGSGRAPGLIGGGQAGYNWQLSSFVVGLEADIQGVFGRSGSITGATGVALLGPDSVAPGTTDLTAFNASKSLSVLGTVRGRAGYLMSPALLAYVTGGLAYGSVSGSAGFTTGNPGYPAAGLASPWGTANFFSEVRAGWTLGAGLEWMFAPGFSVKAEYLYYDLGTVTTELGTSGAIINLPGFAANGSPWFTNASTVATRYSGNILRVGLNYKLGNFPAFPRY